MHTCSDLKLLCDSSVSAWHEGNIVLVFTAVFSSPPLPLPLSILGCGRCLLVEDSGYPDQRYVGCKGDNIMESVDSVRSNLT